MEAGKRTNTNVYLSRLGGIGSHLVRPLCRFLKGSKNVVKLIDGDAYEGKNEDRQEFTGFGNKANIISEELQKSYKDLVFEPKDWYVSEDNAYLAIREGDIVFSCVDNHATRRVLSKQCEMLQDVVLISGGNDYHDGNIQIHIRRGGKNITVPITHLHPEIEKPKDKNPAEMSCEELSKSGQPQIIFTNLMVSAWMLTTFWNYLAWSKGNKSLINYSEIYFDAKTGNARSQLR